MPFFTAEQINTIRQMRDLGPQLNGASLPNYSHIYSYIAGILPQDLPARRWFVGAAQANKGAGVFSVFIRESSKYQMELRGVQYSDQLMQEASNKVATNALKDILEKVLPNGTAEIPNMERIADADATGVGEVLFKSIPNDSAYRDKQNAGWSGTMLFTALGSDQTYRLVGSERVAAKFDSLDDLRNILFARKAYYKALGEAVSAAIYQFGSVFSSWAHTQDTESAIQFFTDAGIGIDTGLNFDYKNLDFQSGHGAFNSMIPSSSPVSSISKELGRYDANSILDMLRRSFNGNSVTKTTTDEEFKQNQKTFFSQFQDLQKLEIKKAKSGRELQTNQRKDFGSLVALNALSIFSFKGDDALALLQTKYANLYSKWTDDKTQPRTDFAGKLNFTSQWTSQRSSMLDWQIAAIKIGTKPGQRINASGGNFYAPVVWDDYIYKDISTGITLDVDGINFTTFASKYIVFGGNSSDTIKGDNLKDSLFGGDGSDDLDGGKDSDYLEGNDGNDTLNGGSDDGIGDYLSGGQGVDEYKFEGKFGNDYVLDRDGLGSIKLRGTVVGEVEPNTRGSWIVNVSGETFVLTLQYAPYRPSSYDMLIHKWNDYTNTILIANFDQNKAYGDEGYLGIKFRLKPPQPNPKPASNFFGAAAAWRPQATDPLTLDLDDDGLETVGLDAANPVYFDYDDDGVKTQTGWVKSDDGFLVLDRNGNGLIDTGSELFGDATPLAAGGKAVDGFAALVEQDSNVDGKVDALDANWQKLRVWRDLNQDGVSQLNELFSLDTLKITSISVAKTEHSVILPNGNEIADLGVFSRSDGTNGHLVSTGNMADINLVLDKYYGQFSDAIPVLADVDLLPNMAGSGLVRGMHEAASLDTNAGRDFQAKLMAYAAATTYTQQHALLDDLIIAWGATSAMPVSHISYIDNRWLNPDGKDVQRINTLERFNGTMIVPETPVLMILDGRKILLDEAWRTFAESVYRTLLPLSRFAPLMDKLVRVEDENGIRFDLTQLETHFQTSLLTLSRDSLGDLIEFNLHMRSVYPEVDWAGYQMLENLIRNTPITPELQQIYKGLGIVLDPTLLNVARDDLGVKVLIGTSENERLRTGRADDLLYGGQGNDYLAGDDGNDVVFGGNGNDELLGEAGNDFLDGGAGDDHLSGGLGNDVYIWGRGSGRDTIVNFDDTAEGRFDRIQISKGVKPEDVIVRRQGELIRLSISGTDDTLTMYAIDSLGISPKLMVNEIWFSDGTVWDARELERLSMIGYEGVDYLFGFESNDEIHGESGSDLVYGRGGNDVLHGDDGDDGVYGDTGNDALYGGSGNDFLEGQQGDDHLYGGVGNDTLDGGEGNNTFYWGIGEGRDEIRTTNYTRGHIDRLVVSGKINMYDVIIWRRYSDFYLSVIGTDDVLKITNAITANDEFNPHSMVHEIIFEEGFFLNEREIMARSLIGAASDDQLVGFNFNDILRGFFGNDILEGRLGDDTLDGGVGNDVLRGESGSDTYLFEGDWGQDTISDLNGKSVIQFGEGVSQANLSFVLNGDDLIAKDTRNGSSILFTAYSRAGDADYLNSEFQFHNGDKLTLRDLLAIKLSSTNNSDTIFGTSLDDVITGKLGDDVLYGRVGEDFLQGDAGNDFLDGGEGGDTLIGGAGNDILLGGGGNDAYYFGRNQGSDFVLDRNAANGATSDDKIVLDADVLPAHVTLYRTSSTNARYNSADDVDDLILVIDGSAQQLCIADFFSITNDSAVETIVFGNGVVWTKQDILSKLIDQSGAVSTFTASAVDDTFVIDNSLDQIVGELGGVDKVFSSVSFNLPQSLEMDIELTGPLNLDASSWRSGAIKGNSGDNVLRKHGLGHVYYDYASLIGGKGDDQYYARGFMDRNGAKLDEINADKIVDNVIENAGEGYDTIITTAYNATLPANVEKLVVSGEAMYAWYFPTSTYIVNHFIGNELDNVIDASRVGSGNPLIDGGAGRDMMIGSGGDDTFIVDHVDDVVVETLLTNQPDPWSALNGDTVRASVTYTLAKNIEHLTLTGSDAINAVGNDANNRLDGSENSAVNHLTGGKGDDTYIVDIQDVVHENDGEGRDTVAFNKPGDYQLSAFQNIENIAFEDWAYELNAANSISGNASDNVLTGNSASNVLVGGAGNDLIYDCSKEGVRSINSREYALANDADQLLGGAGNDTLISYSGADTLDGGDGDDQLVGGKGDTSFVFGHGYGRDRIVSDSGDWGPSHAGDRLIFNSDVHANEVILVRNGTTLSVQLQGSTDTLDIDDFFVDQTALTLNNSIEKIVFSDGSYWDGAAILARLESNNLNALTTGNDLFAGSGSDDVIDALAGDDFIQGDGGNDSILGNAGNDKIFGGAGNDTLNGGSGNDLLIGGVGGDIYRFTRGFGKDFVEEQGTSSTTEIDSVIFDNTILPADVRVEFGTDGSETAIYLKIKGSDDQIILRSSEEIAPWATYYLYQNGVENVQFADGTIWNSQDLIAKATASINHAPYARTGIRDQAGKNGALFQFTIPNNAFYDEDVDDVLTYSATLADGSPLPSWLNFNPSTGTFSGTIDAVETIYINVTVRDSGNLSSSTSFGIYLDQDQTITGTAANDNLRGGIGNDTIYGLAGNDTFYGGYGNDTFVGGVGNEYYSVEDEGDVIIENANEGDDFVRSQVSYTLSDNVERLALDGGSDISATGNTLNNGLWGNDANNLLTGAKGNDYLSGGLGDDIYVFNRGDGQDTIDNKDFLTANDTVRFGSNISDSDVVLSKSGNTLFLKVKGTADQIGISNYYAANTVIDEAPADYKIEKVEFSNGVSWNQTMIQTMVDRALSNRAPTLSTPIANLTTKADQAINFTVPVNTITDADVGDSVTYSLKMKDGTALPVWLSFNASSRLISGTPLAANVGSLNLTLWGTDNYGLSVGQNLTMTVAAANRAPVLSVPLLDQTAAPQSAFAYTIPSNSFTDPDVGDTLSYSATLADGSQLPAWLSFNLSTRAFTGTPTVTETISVKVSAKDTSNLTISDVFNVAVKVSDLTLNGTTNADTLTGGAGNDTLSGLAGNDKLTGNAGNDSLDGGAGSDTLIGGLGDDIYIVDATTDVVTENANEGSDTIKSSVTLTLAANVENLTLTGTTAINGTGNALNNVLTGNSAINTLDGGVGADTLAGAAGNDIYTVDNINDVIVENASEGTDQVNSSVSFTLSANVENLTLTGTASINATGNTAANTLTGNAGNNVIDGGAGNDSMVGGAGNDTYVVDSSGDTVTEAASAGTDLVQSSVSFKLGTNLENLTLTGTANINATGNTAANILFGNSGNNVLDGGTGADAMSGGAGNDIYVLDNAGDVITENASEGIDQVKSSLTYTLIANLEALLLTGTTAINGTGNALDNLLTGNSAKNILNGGAGNDILQGVAGDDTLTDTAGNNIFDGGAGIDVITAGVGNDFIVGGLGNDTITTSSGVDVVAFNRGDGMDTLVASTGKDNTLSLGKGIKYADLLFKKSGNDLILVTGTSEQVTMKDWYTNVNNRSIANLQIVIEGTTDYNAASTNKLNNKKVGQFNFDGLVTKFDQARAANPSLTSWALSSSLLEFYLTSSDTAAIGGDLAYQYAKTGNLSGFTMVPALNLVSNAQFGTSSQALQPVASLKDATVSLV